MACIEQYAQTKLSNLLCYYLTEFSFCIIWIKVIGAGSDMDMRGRVKKNRLAHSSAVRQESRTKEQKNKNKNGVNRKVFRFDAKALYVCVCVFALSSDSLYHTAVVFSRHMAVIEFSVLLVFLTEFLQFTQRVKSLTTRRHNFFLFFFPCSLLR